MIVQFLLAQCLTGPYSGRCYMVSFSFESFYYIDMRIYYLSRIPHWCNRACHCTCQHNIPVSVYGRMFLLLICNLSWRLVILHYSSKWRLCLRSKSIAGECNLHWAAGSCIAAGSVILTVSVGGCLPSHLVVCKANFIIYLRLEPICYVWWCWYPGYFTGLLIGFRNELEGE
jgi:hypothetical protein